MIQRLTAISGPIGPIARHCTHYSIAYNSQPTDSTRSSESPNDGPRVENPATPTSGCRGIAWGYRNGSGPNRFAVGVFVAPRRLAAAVAPIRDRGDRRQLLAALRAQSASRGAAAHVW